MTTDGIHIGGEPSAALAERSDPRGHMQQRLLRVAAQMFRVNGYPGATTRQLADLMGLKKASLYHYVISKSQLLYDICGLAIQTISDEVDAAVKSAPDDERLAFAIRAHIRASIRDLDVHSVMWTEFRYLDPDRQLEIKTRRGEYESRLRQLVRDEQESGRVRDDVDDKYVTRLLINLLNWTIFWYDPQGPLDVDGLCQLMIQQFFEGAQSYQAPLCLLRCYNSVDRAVTRVLARHRGEKVVGLSQAHYSARQVGEWIFS
jgi:TetR/AcrR family transcriptional regulator, cholesterol catabolism regulator